MITRNPLFLLLVLLYTNTACQHISPTSNKIKGISFEGPNKVVDQKCFEPMVSLNANWVCLMPYAYMSEGSPEINFKNLKWQWWGEGRTGTGGCVELAHAKKLKVMMKPHLWIRHGSFTGDMDFESEADWNIWERDYREYILGYAQLSDSLDVEMFCIGTELKTSFQKRPEYWKQLIQDVKKIYKGPLTYAGNWDSYKLFPYWEALDYIGVDAYFPLSDAKNPSIESLQAAWGNWKVELKHLSDEKQKPILFTEYGYRSTDYCTHKPWESHYDQFPVNLEAQKNAYDAMFKEVWKEPWMAGGFLWKWHHQHDVAGGASDNRFTPQNKPAEDLIRNQYSLW